MEEHEWLESIGIEAEDARRRFGEQTDITNADWVNIILEELAEAARCCNEVLTGEAGTLDIEHLRHELVQTGAMALRFLWVLEVRRDAR